MEDKQNDRAGNASGIAIIIGVIAVVTFGFNVFVYVLSQQGKSEEQIDRLAERKADKTDVATQAGDRYTNTMATLEKRCDDEKEILRAQRETLRDAVKGAELKALRWESKADDCETRWQIHVKTCKCGEHER